MIFSSMVFILCFLPVTLLLYFFTNLKYKNFILLIASLFFYAWGEPVYVVLMIVSIITNYFAAILTHKIKKKNYSNALFIMTLVFNISILGFFKYGDFIIQILNSIFKLHIHNLDLPLPIGISFYTFQILSYIIDVWRHKSEPQKNIIDFGLYIAIFPPLIAGPILKYGDMEKQLDASKRNIKLEDIIYGAKRFIIGLGKKVIIANQMGLIADGIYQLNPNEASAGLLWFAMLAYTLQIYFDFSGYSDMAIGLGRILGFRFPENFKWPYISKSITEFWRRWHISLSSWFREYVYIPLGGNRVSYLRWIFNMIVVWSLTGLWHGAAWNFVFWGLYYGILMIIERPYYRYIDHKYGDNTPMLISIINHTYTIFIIMFGWVLFRVEGIDNLITTLIRMFDFGGGGQPTMDFVFNNPDIVFASIFIPFAIFGSLPIIRNIFKKMEKKISGLIIEYSFLVIIFYLCIVMLLGSTYNPFIYFRF